MLPSKLLVSLQSADELSMLTGFDLPWIDLKDPSAGSLGCPTPTVASEFLAAANRYIDRSRCHISIALGELLDESWEQLGPIASSFDFAKVAMAGCAAQTDWQVKARMLAAKVGGGERLILVHYADCNGARSPNWSETLAAAVALRSQFILIDTFNKSAGRLWDWYSPETIRELAASANKHGIELSIAGSLHIDELAMARALGAKVIGVRGAACQDGSRLLGLSRDRLSALTDLFSDRMVTNK